MYSLISLITNHPTIHSHRVIGNQCYVKHRKGIWNCKWRKLILEKRGKITQGTMPFTIPLHVFSPLQTTLFFLDSHTAFKLLSLLKSLANSNYNSVIFPILSAHSFFWYKFVQSSFVLSKWQLVTHLCIQPHFNYHHSFLITYICVLLYTFLSNLYLLYST